jgi:hypothetical protein
VLALVCGCNAVDRRQVILRWLKGTHPGGVRETHFAKTKIKVARSQALVGTPGTGGIPFGAAAPAGEAPPPADDHVTTGITIEPAPGAEHRPFKIAWYNAMDPTQPEEFVNYVHKELVPAATSLFRRHMRVRYQLLPQRKALDQKVPLDACGAWN